MTTKSISIKCHGCESGGCAVKADELTPGDLCCVPVMELGEPQGSLTMTQESAEGKLVSPKRDEGPNG